MSDIENNDSTEAPAPAQAPPSNGSSEHVAVKPAAAASKADPRRAIIEEAKGHMHSLRTAKAALKLLRQDLLDCVGEIDAEVAEDIDDAVPPKEPRRTTVRPPPARPGLARATPVAASRRTTMPATPAARAPQKAKPAVAKAAAQPTRLARRSAEQIAGKIDEVVELVKGHKDGLRSEQIREALDMLPKEMPKVLGDGLAAGRLKKKGEKRATLYFAK